MTDVRAVTDSATSAPRGEGRYAQSTAPIPRSDAVVRSSVFAMARISRGSTTVDDMFELTAEEQQHRPKPDSVLLQEIEIEKAKFELKAKRAAIKFKETVLHAEAFRGVFIQKDPPQIMVKGNPEDPETINRMASQALALMMRGLDVCERMEWINALDIGADIFKVHGASEVMRLPARRRLTSSVRRCWSPKTEFSLTSPWTPEVSTLCERLQRHLDLPASATSQPRRSRKRSSTNVVESEGAGPGNIDLEKLLKMKTDKKRRSAEGTQDRTPSAEFRTPFWGLFSAIRGLNIAADDAEVSRIGTYIILRLGTKIAIELGADSTGRLGKLVVAVKKHLQKVDEEKSGGASAPSLIRDQQSYSLEELVDAVVKKLIPAIQDLRMVHSKGEKVLIALTMVNDLGKDRALKAAETRDTLWEAVIDAQSYVVTHRLEDKLRKAEFFQWWNDQLKAGKFKVSSSRKKPYTTGGAEDSFADRTVPSFPNHPHSMSTTSPRLLRSIHDSIRDQYAFTDNEELKLDGEREKPRVTRPFGAQSYAEASMARVTTMEADSRRNVHSRVPQARRTSMAPAVSGGQPHRINHSDVPPSPNAPSVVSRAGNTRAPTSSEAAVGAAASKGSPSVPRIRTPKEQQQKQEIKGDADKKDKEGEVREVAAALTHVAPDYSQTPNHVLEQQQPQPREQDGVQSLNGTTGPLIHPTPTIQILTTSMVENLETKHSKPAARSLSSDAKAAVAPFRGLDLFEPFGQWCNDAPSILQGGDDFATAHHSPRSPARERSSPFSTRACRLRPCSRALLGWPLLLSEMSMQQLRVQRKK